MTWKSFAVGVVTGAVLAGGTAIGVTVLNDRDGNGEPAPVASSPGPEPDTTPTETETPEPVDPTPVEDGITTKTRVRFDGMGALFVGMSVEEAEAATGETFELSDQFPSEGCTYAFLEGGPKGLAFMVEFGIIARIDVVDNVRILTDRDIGIGATLADIESAYPVEDISIDPHPYNPDGAYAEVWDPAAQRYRAIFELDANDVVTSYRTGQKNQVRYIEGCA